jgi:mono/diheme cytochrome c family protein
VAEYWLLGIFFNMRTLIVVCLGLVGFGLKFASAGWLMPAGSQERSGYTLFDQTNLSEGKKLFETRCFVCHGRDGKGDGPSAMGLAEKPQDLTDPNWQKSNSDDLIGVVIKDGGVAIGKTGAMPPNPDLTQNQIQGLVAFVRSLARK